jgi:hypothetical protein
VQTSARQLPRTWLKCWRRHEHEATAITGVGTAAAENRVVDVDKLVWKPLQGVGTTTADNLVTAITGVDDSCCEPAKAITGVGAKADRNLATSLASAQAVDDKAGANTGNHCSQHRSHWASDSCRTLATAIAGVGTTAAENLATPLLASARQLTETLLHPQHRAVDDRLR